MTITTAVPLMHCDSGVKFNPFEPRAEDIRIEDIAHHLSNVCRYGGACKEFYSVAQHSFICSMVAPAPLKGRLLLHDASEGYIGDIISPFKMTEYYEMYRDVEANLMAAIYQKYGLEIEDPPEVHEIDILVRHTEMRDFGSVSKEVWENEEMLPFTINPVSPKKAEILFLTQFAKLFG